MRSKVRKEGLGATVGGKSEGRRQGTPWETRNLRAVLPKAEQGPAVHCVTRINIWYRSCSKGGLGAKESQRERGNKGKKRVSENK